MYADSTAVLGPLALQADPGSYDLCQHHASSLSAPRGWEIIRLPELDAPEPEPDHDDLLALANAVREVGLGPEAAPPRHNPPGIVEIARRGHLTVLADPDA